MHNADNQNLANIKRTLLWENSNTAAAFTEQSIKFDISAYTALDIVFRLSTTSQSYATYRHEIGVKTGNNTPSNGDGSHYFREVTPSAAGTITIGKGTIADVGPDNSKLIPYRIYGVR